MSNVKEYIRQLKATNAPFEKQEIALTAIEKAIQDAKANLAKKEEKVTKNIDLILTAFNKIETKLNNKYEELLKTPAMVGEKGEQGKAGRDGKDGKDGKDGLPGHDGKDGRDGVDGKDGVGVVDAYIDFDGSLVIKLSDGNELDAGKVVAETVAKEFNAFMTRGEIIPLQDGNSGKFLTTDGSTLSWATVSGGGGGGVTSAIAGTGISVSSATGNVTFTNTAPDQTVVLTAGTGITTSGTYPNFTITNASPMTYPGAGMAVSTGSAWGTSKTTPTGDVVGTSDTQTLTNKRINPRVVAASGTSGNLTINGDTTDLYKAEGLTGAITFLQPSGTPVDGQKLMIRLEDDGTARGITWTTSAGAFRAVGITLPTTTVLGKVTYVGCVYNSTDSFWDAVATVTQA